MFSYFVVILIYSVSFGLCGCCFSALKKVKIWPMWATLAWLFHRRALDLCAGFGGQAELANISRLTHGSLHHWTLQCLWLTGTPASRYKHERCATPVSHGFDCHLNLCSSSCLFHHDSYVIFYFNTPMRDDGLFFCIAFPVFIFFFLYKMIWMTLGELWCMLLGFIHNFFEFTFSSELCSPAVQFGLDYTSEFYVFHFLHHWRAL